MVNSHCVNSTVEVVGLFMMVGAVKLFVMVELLMMLGMKLNFLSGPGQASISNKYRAQRMQSGRLHSLQKDVAKVCQALPEVGRHCWA